jgi:hypothetical protein
MSGREFIALAGNRNRRARVSVASAMEKTMRKIVLSGLASLALVCCAFGADARSSDEEDTPQSSVEAAERLSPANASRRAEGKPFAGAHRPVVAPAPEDDKVRY